MHENDALKYVRLERIRSHVCSQMESQLSLNGGSWFKLFSKMDVEQSGKVTFEELDQILRIDYNIKKRNVSEREVHFIYQMLDKDNND